MNLFSLRMCLNSVTFSINFILILIVIATTTIIRGHLVNRRTMYTPYSFHCYGLTLHHHSAPVEIKGEKHGDRQIRKVRK